MSDILLAAIRRAVAGKDLDAEEMRGAMAEIMEGRASEVRTAALLTALAIKGESVSEIVGTARAMQERATPIKTVATGLLDTCGTGGDELFTFNISTATALVAAAAGVPVAKHGNRSVSSSSGSADVLEQLGVNINLAPDQVAKLIDNVGIGFCFAPLVHGAMKHAAPVRRELGFRTIFNIVGPLTNPAGGDFQLVGANRCSTAEKIAWALAQLGRRRALIVCGNNELDEVSLWGETHVFTVTADRVVHDIWTRETFGLPECSAQDLRVQSAAESAAVIRDVFAGKNGPARDIVLANAAAALVAAERAGDPREGVVIAARAIDSGMATEICRKLAEMSNR